MELFLKWISWTSSTAMLIAVAIFASSESALADSAPIATTEITHDCQDWLVPTGHVITSSNGFTAACNGLNEYTVSLPVAGMATRSISPISDDFMATSELEDDAMCGTKNMPVKAYRLSATATGVGCAAARPGRPAT